MEGVEVLTGLDSEEEVGEERSKQKDADDVGVVIVFVVLVEANADDEEE